jgi:hypothetical protein
MRHIAFNSFACLVLALRGGLAVEDQLQAPFDKIAVHGGGKVLVEFGDRSRASLVEPETNTRQISVEDGTLHVRCRRPCSDRGAQTVRVTVPSLSSIAVNAGGSVKLGKGFARTDALAVQVLAGGSIDAASLQARVVTAAVTAGGSVTVLATEQLQSRISAGGQVNYYGDPRVDAKSFAGGSVRRLGRP